MSPPPPEETTVSDPMDIDSFEPHSKSQTLPVYSKESHIVWDALMSGDTSQRDILVSNLHHRGFCLVEWPEQLHPTNFPHVSHPRGMAGSTSYAHPLHMGYVKTEGKTGLRYLTGGHLQQDGEWVDPYSVRELQTLTRLLDQAQVGFMTKFATDLFPGRSAVQVAIESRAPLLSPLIPEDQRDTTDTPYPYALFDAVTYRPPTYYDQEVKKVQVVPGKEVAVAPHCDPGLFAFSIFESRAGLGLFDPVSNNWFEPFIATDDRKNYKGSKYGVIWCGSAANEHSAGFLRACQHRVQFDPSQPMYGGRSTMWQELSVPSQLPPEAHRGGLRGTGSHTIKQISSTRHDSAGNTFNIYCLLETGQRVTPDSSLRPGASADSLKGLTRKLRNRIHVREGKEPVERGSDEESSAEEEQGPQKGPPRHIRHRPEMIYNTEVDELSDSEVDAVLKSFERASEYDTALGERTAVIDDPRSSKGKALQIRVAPEWSLLDVLFAIERTWNAPFSKMSPSVWLGVKRLSSFDQSATLADIGLKDGDILSYGMRPSKEALNAHQETTQQTARKGSKKAWNTNQQG